MKSKALYGNIRVMPPARDILMFRTTVERAMWYVEMGLGVLEAQDLLRLTFEPKGPGHSEDPYFLQEFKNRCVVCGLEESLSHHHIVPECYRRYFPRDSQAGGAWMYDVLLLCWPCHMRYEEIAWEMKVTICKKYGVPISGKTNVSRDKIRAIKAAASLDRHGDKIPAYKRMSLEEDLRVHLGREVSKEEYEPVRKALVEGIEHVPMGKLVAEKIEDLDAFAVSWREHFVKAMKPEYLPEGWVSHRRIYGSVR